MHGEDQGQLLQDDEVHLDETNFNILVTTGSKVKSEDWEGVMVELGEIKNIVSKTRNICTKNLSLPEDGLDLPRKKVEDEATGKCMSNPKGNILEKDKDAKVINLDHFLVSNQSLPPQESKKL